LLKVENILVEDAGTYICTTANVAGVGNASIRLDVDGMYVLNV